MDRTITAREANRRFPAILRDGQRGETFVVTSQGLPVALSGGCTLAGEDVDARESVDVRRLAKAHT